MTHSAEPQGEQESSVLFSLQEILKLESSRVAEQEARCREEELRAAAAAHEAELESRRQAADLLRQQEEDRRRAELRKKEEQARLEAIRTAEIERARKESEHEARLRFTLQQQRHEERLASIKQDQSKRRLRRTIFALAFCALAGAAIGVWRADAASVESERRRAVLEAEKLEIQERIRAREAELGREIGRMSERQQRELAALRTRLSKLSAEKGVEPGTFEPIDRGQASAGTGRLSSTTPIQPSDPPIQPKEICPKGDPMCDSLD